jgi:hypothetical protein
VWSGQDRIEVGAAIAESDGIVCQVDLVKLLGDPPGKSSVNAELKVLERANLLTRPNVTKDRRIDLVRQDSPWWDMCLGLREATARSARGEVPPRCRRRSSSPEYGDSGSGLAFLQMTICRT